MKYLKPKDAARLADYSAPACVTIYLPLAGPSLGPELRQDTTRLKNLVRRTQEKLSALSYHSARLDARLGLLPLIGTETGQAPGLVWFLSDDIDERYALPSTPTELVTVAKEFDLTAAASLSWHQADFYVLSVSQHQVRFWHGNAEALHQIILPELPDSLPDAVWYKKSERPRGAGTSHGQSEDTRETRANLNEYLHMIEKIVTKYLERSTTPLVLAGTEPTLGMYRKINSYPHLVDEAITAKPETTAPQDLYRRAHAIVHPLDQLPRQQALEEFQRLQSTAPELATTDLSQMIQAAEAGKVDTLFVSSTPVQEFFESMDLPEDSQEVASILVKQVTRYTLKNGGRVYDLEDDDIHGAQIAAILRH